MVETYPGQIDYLGSLATDAATTALLAGVGRVAGRLASALDNTATSIWRNFKNGNKTTVTGVTPTSKYTSTAELESHIIHGNGATSRLGGVNGAHNMNDFSEALLNSRGRVVSFQPIPEMPGAYFVEYQLPALDPKTALPTAVFRNNTYIKTVYDPKQIPDSRFISRGLEAANDPAVKVIYKNGNPSEWNGVDSQGVKWKGYYSLDGKPTSFFPSWKQ